MNYTPVFILGNPRSGTSLLRIILDSHNDIVSPPEGGFAQWLYGKYNNWKWSVNDKKIISRFADDVLQTKKFETWGVSKKEILERIEHNQPTNYGDLVACVYLAYGTGNEKVIVDKNNYYINYLNTIHKIWPNAKYIHMIRDGRDVACSYMDVNGLKTDSKYKPQLPANIKDIAQEWYTNNWKIQNFCNDKNSFLVKYESLITSPSTVSASICKWLDISYQESMLDYHKNKIKEPVETLDWKIKTTKKVDSNNRRKYLKILSDEELIIFTAIAGSLLNEYDYE